MKANLFAAVLSFLFMSLPLQAAINPVAVSAVVKQDSASEKINLNQADVKMLSGSVKGIGKKRAESIVKYRESHGEFKSVEELAQVQGLGAGFVKSHLAELEQRFTLK